MQILIDIDKLKTRAREAGIEMRAICAEAGVSVSTPSHIKRSGNGHVRTLTKLSMALFRLERRRLEELKTRVPDQDGLSEKVA